MHSFGRRVAALGGTARGAKGQLVQYVSRLKGQMMSTLYCTLVCPRRTQLVVVRRAPRQQCQGCVHVSDLGLMKGCKQPRLLVCPGALPC